MSELSKGAEPPVLATAVDPPPRRRRRWVALLLMAVIFFSGFAVGGATALVFVRNQIVQAIRHPEQGPSRIASMLATVLRLSPEQKSSVIAILRQRQQKLMAIRAKVQPEVETELDAVKNEISAVLEPAQRAKWERIVNRLRDTWLPPRPSVAMPADKSGANTLPSGEGGDESAR